MSDPAWTRVEGLRGVRYGELLIVHGGESFHADVWNTLGLNDCPPDEYAAIDAAAVAAGEGALLAMKNGPRHWVLDAIEVRRWDPPPVRRFGTLSMFLAATVDLGETLTPPRPYTEVEVARDTVFEWGAGSTLHELVSPAGVRYVMQALALSVDASQTIESLSALADRLELPDGWRFASRMNDQPLRLLSSEDGVATVVQDELANTYQRVDRTA